MLKRVFIIPEPHIWDKNFKNRNGYPAEISGYLQEIIDHIQALDGEKIVIFPGDIFHQGFTSVSGMTRALNFFVTLNKITQGNVYSVVGNHELTYVNNNPFWMMAEDYTSRFTEQKSYAAYGIFRPGIKIKDELIIGKLKFIFGHYGRTDYKVIPGKEDLVLISHNSLIESTIEATMKDKYKRDLPTEYMRVTRLTSSAAIPLTSILKYVFVGHMHTMYSQFLVDDDSSGIHLKFRLRYLGSLGRTSIREIDNNDLVRTIPQFVVENDGTYTYDPFNIQLQTYEQVIDSAVTKENAEKAAKIKTLKHVAESNTFGETPEDCIRRELANTPAYLSLFEEIFNHFTDNDIIELLKEAKLL